MRRVEVEAKVRVEMTNRKVVVAQPEGPKLTEMGWYWSRRGVRIQDRLMMKGE